MKSLLQLNKCELKSLSLNRSKKPVEPGVERVAPTLKVQREMGKTRFDAALALNIFHPEGLSECSSIRLELNGKFSLPENTPEEVVKKYVPLLCFTNLLGMARGVLAQVTSMCEGGPYILPCLDINQALQKTSVKTVAQLNR